MIPAAMGWPTTSGFSSLVGSGIIVLAIGMGLCIYRLMRGPHLVDRVLAADVLSLQVVGLVVLLATETQRSLFLDAALVVAITGFASTLAFAQYIGRHKAERVVQARQGGEE